MIKKTSQDEIQNFLKDASNIKGECEAVYFPESIDEINDIVKEASKNKKRITVAGNGTGLGGARVPEGGIVVSTEKLNRIIEINRKEKYAIVEPGVLLSEFQEDIKNNGLLYPPDPTEKDCFIGGTIATNASGEKTFKYGPTRNYVLELEIVLSNGESLLLKRGELKADDYKLKIKTDEGNVIELNIPDYKMPDTKNASGYYVKNDVDAIDLFIGSEGTLGIIKKAKLKLVDLPESLISCLIFFDNEKNALDFIKAAREFSFVSRNNSNEKEIDALALEFFDKNALDFLRDDYPNIPDDTKAGVWFEQEVISATEDLLLHHWMELLGNHFANDESAWFAYDEKEKKKIQEFRHAISEKVNDYIANNNFKKLGTDVAVPDDNFEQLYYSSKKMVEEKGLDYVAYGHFGNSHLHLNMLPKNQDEYKTGKDVYKQICRKAIELGGTVSAEHGIGKLKTDYLIDMYGEEKVKQMAKLKQQLDPFLLLGYGNIIDPKFYEK